MKLVDILARELKVWPEGYDNLQQSFAGMVFHGAKDGILPIARLDVAEDFRTAEVTRAEWQAAVDAPKSPEWNGEGLPPVGTVCEWAGCTFAPEDPKEPDLHIGDQVKIIAHFKDGELDLAAFTFNPQIHNPDRGTAWVNQGAYGCFRHIRTPEQIAAEERASQIELMADIFRDAPQVGVQAGMAALYDAGYRKFEIVEGE